MGAAELISARQEGASFEQVLGMVRGGKERDGSLPPEQLKFFESMLDELRKGTEEFDAAVASGDLARVKTVAESFQEIFQMVEDSCDS